MSALNATAVRSGEGLPLLVTYDQGARIVGLGLVKFKQVVSAGEIRTVQVGKRRMVPRAEIDAWISRATA